MSQTSIQSYSSKDEQHGNITEYLINHSHSLHICHVPVRVTVNGESDS